jgi:hypothetical protein
VFLVGHAVGVQIYTCNGSTWSSAVPRADLYDDNGKLIITHFRGPTWQAKDGSQAVGTVVNKVNLDPTAIDWVLLSTKTTPGPTVTGSWTQPSSSGSTPPVVTLPCRGLQRHNGKQRGRSPVHGRLRLLEEDRRLTRCR